MGAVHPCRDVAERRTGVVDDEDGQSGRLGDVDTLGVGEHRDGTALGGLGCELRTVAVRAVHADEQVTRLHLGSAQGDAGRLDGVQRPHDPQAEAVGQLGHGPRGRVFGSEDRGDPCGQVLLLPHHGDGLDYHVEG